MDSKSSTIVTDFFIALEKRIYEIDKKELTKTRKYLKQTINFADFEPETLDNIIFMNHRLARHMFLHDLMKKIQSHGSEQAHNLFKTHAESLEKLKKNCDDMFLLLSNYLESISYDNKPVKQKDS